MILPMDWITLTFYASVIIILISIFYCVRNHLDTQNRIIYWKLYKKEEEKGNGENKS